MSWFRGRTRRASRIIAAFLRLGLAVSAPHAVSAQGTPGAPAVGVVEVAKRSITEKSEFLGRIEAIHRVNILARVTAFMEKRLFTEGAEVSTNDQLYLLERGPFQADLDAKKAQVAQLEATLANAKLTAERQRILLSGPAGVQANYDTAISNQKSLEAQVQAAEAQVNLSQINLDYTEIRFADRRKDRTHRGHRRQRRESHDGDADDHCQSGPDACELSHLRETSAGTARAICCQGRSRRCRHRSKASGWSHLRSDRASGLRKQLP